MTAETRLVPSLSAAHEPGTNLVWSAAVSLAWRELQVLAGGPIRLDLDAGDITNAAAAAALVAELNDNRVDSTVVDPKSCVARAGRQTLAFLDEVRAELRRKVPGAAPRLLPTGDAPDRFIAWAYLQHHLPFEVPFFLPGWRLHFRGSYVACFGVPFVRDRAEWEKRARQLRIHHPCYTEEEVAGMAPEDWDAKYDRCVVELHSRRSDVRLVLAMIPPAARLGDTVQRAMRLVDQHPEDHPHARLGFEEQFAAPILDIDLVREWAELRGRAIASGSLAGHRFGEVVGATRFRLDEGGASMTAEWLSRGLSLPPRELLFSRPFLVMILRRGQTMPMFALWVENTSPMTLQAPRTG